MFEWRRSVHYWWSYILFSPECRVMLYWWSYILFSPECRVNQHARPSTIQVGCPPVVIRCVHWTMQMWVLQTRIIAQGLAIVMNPNSIFELRKKSKTRGHKKKLFKRRSRLNVRKGSFSQRTVNDWNSLPQAVIESESLDQLKNRLDRHWLGRRYMHPFEITS